MEKGFPIMIQGTHSDSGKSVIATAFCRMFANAGYKTAPFKSQNMALNSYITQDGKEIGRAQGVQAEAARVLPTTDMNPILIKPTGDSQSQIVVHGKPMKNMKATEYRQDFFEQGLQIITDSYQRLAEKYDRIVIEGAGSPAEINLNDRELVNMRVAKMANAPVILVGDIDKGGVFASLVGTLQLLTKEERDRVVGVIINKFRGDINLLTSGLTWFEGYTGKKVLGVVPFIPKLHIDAEDSVVLDTYNRSQNGVKDIDIAVIRYPFISNFTDIDPFHIEEDCHVRFVSNIEELGKPDLVILPGSKNTIDDCTFLHNSGLTEGIQYLHQEQNTLIFGICGGYQMLGEMIEDPFLIETSQVSCHGLGILPIQTTITKEKKTTLSEGYVEFEDEQVFVTGYEIHMGVTSKLNQCNPFVITGKHTDGCVKGKYDVIGTYFHGIMHNDLFRTKLLNHLRVKKGLSPINLRPSFNGLREESFEKLAEIVEQHLDLDTIQTEMKKFSNNFSGMK
ncbi:MULTISPECIES: cobyric acid synthase [Bacillaceae]|uniref:cobyric acid synthase n=1 Tax=Bacillaceae TaxID=186817 RepID=UPI002A16743A|nr:cobyric acid synthase [Cytobacillus sp. IB215316]MDX8359196.1 cobyric acid synthase [Cytobacillus sp. IB215316]